MLTKNEIKTIQSLKIGKYRQENKLFVVEGYKMVDELLESRFTTERICITETFKAKNPSFNYRGLSPEIVSEKQMEQMSNQDTPPGILAVVKIPQQRNLEENTLILALDGINNPGNLGTIIRTAEWFGIKNIVCSEDCVEIWNPKVIQSTMGSIFRMTIIRTNLEEYLLAQKTANIPIYGALLEGEDIYKKQMIKSEGVIVIGSESHGIRSKLLRMITDPITIPRDESAATESLNASIATAIIMSEIWRKLR